MFARLGCLAMNQQVRQKRLEPFLANRLNKLPVILEAKFAQELNIEHGAPVWLVISSCLAEGC